MACEQKVQFYIQLEDTISKLIENNRDNFCITQEKYEKALTSMELPKGAKCPNGAHFKFWCKKHFKVQKIGSSNVLYCVKTSCPVMMLREDFLPCYDVFV